MRDSDTTKKNEIDETDDAFPLSSTCAASSLLLESSNFQTAREEEEEDRSHDNGDKDIAFSNIKDDDDVAVCRTDLVPKRDKITIWMTVGGTRSYRSVIIIIIINK